MQFACESCKTQLQIADEKVRGKRLLVRCKRCGAKITISDPLLAKRPATGPLKPQLSSAPPPVPIPRKDSDTESTRAMDSDLLEKALQASRAENPAAVLAQKPPAQPQDLPAWFAMLQGKQTGPMTLQELRSRVDGAEVGPRTYLWREGMGAWQRARDVAELVSLFPPPLEVSLPPPAPLPSRPVPLPAPQRPSLGDAEEPTRPDKPFAADEGEHTDVDPAPLGNKMAELFDSGESEPTSTNVDSRASAVPVEPGVRTLPPGVAETRRRTTSSQRMFESAADSPKSRLPVIIGAIALIVALAVGAIYVAAERKPEPPPPSAPHAAAPVAPSSGPTAEEVRRKIGEKKAALQDCIDDALRKDANLRVGKIHIATTVAPTGKVLATRIDKRTVDDSPLGACLKEATRQIEFPPFAGDKFEVDIPIVVTPGD